MKDTESITCHTFREGEKDIEVLTREISTAPVGQPKVLKAKELLKAAEKLLNCPEYDASSVECQSCRGIANLRKQLADLVMKVHRIIGRTRP
jgi:hypothetical protein